jgi:hypothetical protein
VLRCQIRRIDAPDIVADSGDKWNVAPLTAEERTEMERRQEENDRKWVLEMYEDSEEIGRSWNKWTIKDLEWIYRNALAKKIRDKLQGTFRIKRDYQTLGHYMQNLYETYTSKSRYYKSCSLDLLRFADVNLKLALENCLIDSYGVAEWWNDNHVQIYHLKNL